MCSVEEKQSLRVDEEFHSTVRISKQTSKQTNIELLLIQLFSQQIKHISGCFRY